MTDDDRRRRTRWLVRCIGAIESAPDAHRLSIRSVLDRIALGGLTARESDALLDTLDSLLIDALDIEHGE